MTPTRPRSRRRAVVALVALIGVVLALTPATAAVAAGESITVTNPAFSTSWTVGSSRVITWATDLNDAVKIDLLNEPGGTVASSIVASTPGKAGKFTWQIPATATTGNFKIRVQGVNDAAVTDTSGGVLALALPVVDVTAPTASDVWTHGTTKPIKWTTPFTGKVQIHLMDGGSPVTVIKDNVNAAAKTFSWQIPVGVATNGTYQVRVRSVENPSITDTSASFQLNRPTPSVLAPLGSTTWGTGTTQNVRWSLPVPGNVKVDLLDNSNALVTSIKTSVSAKAGTVRWTIPALATPGTYKVRVQHLTDADLTVTSAPFTISLGDLNITSPNGGESWLMGTNHPIRWTTSIAGNVKVELVDSNNAVVSGHTPKASIAATAKSFSWAIPPAVATSGLYTIRVTSLANPLVKDESNQFTLTKPSITVGTPADVSQGASRLITWTTDLPTGNVKIEADPTAAGPNIVIKTVSAKSQQYSWAVPASFPLGEYTIVITAANAATITDASNAPFDVIAPVFDVDTPSGPWAAGTTQSVTWDSPVSGNVKIELVGTGGTKIIKSSIAASSTSFSWAIPLNIATATATWSIKVTWLSNPAVSDTSNSTFTLTIPTLLVSVANSTPTTWNKGVANNITWSGLTSGSVKVELIRTSGTGPQTLLVRASISAALQSVSYTFPNNAAGSEYRVKITAITNSAITDQSDSVITVT